MGDIVINYAIVLINIVTVAYITISLVEIVFHKAK